MNPNISFDPNILSDKEKTFLKAKLELTYDGEDPDGCKVFNLKAREKGSHKRKRKYWYKTWSITNMVAKYFGNQKYFTPSAIAYSLHHGVVLLKKSDMVISHLCGYVLCFNTNHLTQENNRYNRSRRMCHANRRIPWVCPHIPQCIMKTVDMKK